MTKYYPPVFGYKPSFDSKKGDKNKMEVHYTRRMETLAAGRGRHGGKGGRGAAAPHAQHKMMKRTVEVRICETNNFDATLWTIYKFKRKGLISEMPWSEARYNFLPTVWTKFPNCG